MAKTNPTGTKSKRSTDQSGPGDRTRDRQVDSTSGELEILFVDVETRSEISLKDGYSADGYAAHKSTEILCLSWAFGNDPFRLWIPASEPAPAKLQAHRGLTVAHNVGFERAIWRNILIPQFGFGNVTDWICTAALCRSNGLPGGLNDAARWFFGDEGKDKAGRAAMLKLSKPRKPRKNETLFPDVVGPLYHSDPEALQAVGEYCKIDTDLSRRLYFALKPINETERAVWEQDQRANRRGVFVDVARVDRLIGLLEKTEAIAHKDARALGLDLLTSHQQFLAWCAAHEFPLENCQADYLTEQENEAPPLVRKMIRRKRLVGSTSTRKLYKLRTRTQADHVCRDNLIYHGAHTGRFTGTGVQLHNLPRGNFPASVVEKDLALSDEAIGLLYGSEVLSFISSALRGCFTARPGYELFVGDFSSIEMRVLFWLAGDADALRICREGGDLYVNLASRIYGVPLDRVTDEQREVGKRGILGAGYGMGWSKFIATAKAFGGVELPTALAKATIATYRNVHAPVPRLWQALNCKAVDAVLRPGVVFVCGLVAFRFDPQQETLACRLPSGRVMRYRHVKTRKKTPPWGGEPVRELWHLTRVGSGGWAVLPTYGGRLAENITQAVARDLMVEASLRLESAGFAPLLSVHDEVIHEKEKGGSLDLFTETMQAAPDWAHGCPIEVKTWKGKRYRK